MAMEAMAAPGSKIRSLGDLWMTLERRCRKALPYGWSPEFCIPAIPNNRPREPIELGLGRYYVFPQDMDPGTLSIMSNESGYWIFDPLEIPDLTKSLMSTLERAESPLTNEGFSNRFDSLPPEIRNMIIEDLIACSLTEGSSSLECTYLIPQYCWKQAIIQIPFLWDLENEIVEWKDQEAMAGSFEWNWEKLARQILLEIPIFRFKAFRFPPQLDNRRRIWQILMEMYPNDVGMVNSMDEEDEGAHRGEGDETDEGGEEDQEDEDSESESILHDHD